jgi:hypothetical protein
MEEPARRKAARGASPNQIPMHEDLDSAPDFARMLVKTHVVIADVVVEKHVLHRL